MAGLTKRKQTWHLRMRVPRRYRAIESRSEITRSLRTTSRKEAFVRLLTVEAIVIAELDARLAMTEPGNSGEAYAAGIALTASRGITYLPVQELAQSPMEEILERIEALKRNDGPQMPRAIPGGLKAPGLKLSGFVEEVERISAYDNRYKSAEQMPPSKAGRCKSDQGIGRGLSSAGTRRGKGEASQILVAGSYEPRRAKSGDSEQGFREHGLHALSVPRQFGDAGTSQAIYKYSDY